MKTLLLGLVGLALAVAACAGPAAAPPTAGPTLAPGLTPLGGPTTAATAPPTPGTDATLRASTPTATDPAPPNTTLALSPTAVIALPGTAATLRGSTPTITAAPATATRPPATRAASATPQSTATPGTAATLRGSTPTPTEGPCVNDAVFIADLTVPDGAQFLPTQTFVKQWRVKNTGTCDWGPGYRLVLVSGDALTNLPGVTPQIEFALYPARAGTEATWEVPMRAPEAPGAYTGRWTARDPQGNFFGAIVFITIEVIPLPTP